MARRKPEDDLDPFGVSLLDMLTCALGAIALLFILSASSLQKDLDAANAASAKARQELAKAAPELPPDKVEHVALNVMNNTKRVPAGQASRLSNLDVAPFDSTRHLLVLLDTSGSMSRYLPAGTADALPQLTAENTKWQDSLLMVLQVIASIPDLSGFQILPITDNAGPFINGQSLVEGSTSGWIDPGAAVAAIGKLGRLSPRGGSDHGQAISAAWDYIDGRRNGEVRADTLLIVTDGLPNHGVVFGCAGDQPLTLPDELRACIAAGTCSNMCKQHPTSGYITPESRVRRAQAAVERLHGLVGAMNPNTRPRIHVLLMPWPDDAALTLFGLEMASIGGGQVLSPGLTPRLAARAPSTP